MGCEHSAGCRFARPTARELNNNDRPDSVRLVDHAAGFFSAKEVNDRYGIDSAKALWDWLASGDYREDVAPGWHMSAGENLVFRGQPQADWGISSKLFRDLRETLRRRGLVEVSEPHLAQAEARLIGIAQEEGVGRHMTRGELLMVLQHHGVATRLLDVSLAPLEALFFAVDQFADRDGRLFLIFVHGDGETETSISLAESEAVPWLGVQYGTQRVKGDWTKTVALVKDPALDPRMRAQRGAFLVGGMIKRYAGERMPYGSHELVARDFADVTTLRINFLRNRRSEPNYRYGASGWTIRVKKEWKSDLMSRLAGLQPGITPDTMYPPVDELRRLAAREIRNFAPGVPPSG